MEFEGFDWDAGNRDKCCKHGVSIVEIESVFVGLVVILPDKDNPSREPRFRAIGRTISRRPAFVVFTMRQIAEESRVRPISARFMHGKEIESYERAYPELKETPDTAH